MSEYGPEDCEVSSEVAAFDYAALPGECAIQVRAATQRIHLRTSIAIVENGKDLLTVRNMPEMKGRFVAWLKAEFRLSEATAYRMIRVAENLGEEFVTVTNIGPNALYALAAPSTPDEVREEVETRAINGEKITVAEVERLKREAHYARASEERLKREAKQATDRAATLELELKEISAIGGENARRSEEYRKKLEQAEADRRVAEERAAELARAEARKEMEKELAAAVREVERARAGAQLAEDDAKEALESAEEARASLEEAVRKARADAESLSDERALVAAEAAIAKRQAEVSDLERRAQKAKDRAERHAETERQLAESIRQHQERIKTIGSAELEAPAQIESAKRVMAAIYDGMTDLHGFDYEPTPDAAKQWDIARQMCDQLAAAICGFLTDRQESPRRAIA